MLDPLNDIHHYSSTFTISQIIKFCEKKGLSVSRAMIQNYIRAGLFPPPVNRLYTQKHLAALVIIIKLKNIYDIQAIKEVMTPHMDEEGLPLEIYRWLISKQQEILDEWIKNVAPTITSEAEEMQRLLLMTHAADITEL